MSTSEHRYISPGGKPLLVILSGPSGVGKDTVFRRFKQMGRPFHYIVTATTRRPRAGEKDGLDYHFLSVQDFEERIAQNKMLEWARVYGQYYGVPREEVEGAQAKGQNVIVKVDVQGAITLKRLFPEALAIFLAPPSQETLAERLEHRKSETKMDLEKRLETAPEEMKSAQFFDHVVVNHQGRLDETVARVEETILAHRRK